MIMTNTEIRKANVATLRKEAKSKGIDVDGMNRADLIGALLNVELANDTEKDEKPVEQAVNAVKLVRMVNPDGLEADVHPDMVEDYKLGDYVEV